MAFEKELRKAEKKVRNSHKREECKLRSAMSQAEKDLELLKMDKQSVQSELSQGIKTKDEHIDSLK